MPCSFCGGSHTIKKCNSARLTELNALLEQSLENGSRYVFAMLMERLTFNEVKVLAVTKVGNIRSNRRSSVITFAYALMDLYFLDWRPDGSADGRRFNQAEVDAEANEMFELIRNYTTVNALDPQEGAIMYLNLVLPSYRRMSRQAMTIYSQLVESHNTGLLRGNVVKPSYSIMVHQTTEKIPMKATQDCDVCMECVPARKFVVFNCNHELCGGCVGKLLKSTATTNKAPACHMCRAVMTNFTAKSTPTFKAVTKILA